MRDARCKLDARGPLMRGPIGTARVHYDELRKIDSAQQPTCQKGRLPLGGSVRCNFRATM
jgi:hypothetical protein